jgi:hypothetical protein
VRRLEDTKPAETPIEEHKVTTWRLDVLFAAGYDLALATEIACRNDVDLHQAVELVRRGCPPALAARILL